MNISVVIPCRNEEKYIALCLDSLIEAKPENFALEIFVCDGLSTDNTREIVSNYANKYDYIHLLDNLDKYTPYALNKGIRESKHELIAILGAHAEVAKDYFKNALDFFKNNPEAACIGGVLENVYEDETSKAVGLAMSSSFGVGNAYFRTGEAEGEVDTVAFGIYKKEVFDKVGLFDEDLVRNQDDEFNYRVTKAGLKIFLTKSLKCKYYVRSSFTKLYTQYYQYGLWKVFVNKKHNTITSIRQLIPLLFVLAILLNLILGFIFTVFFYFLTGILALYFAVAMYAALKLTNNIKAISLIIYTFLILHLSYGIGYLEGIIRFVLLNKGVKKHHLKSSR